MALVLGSNSGFVTTAPTADPDAAENEQKNTRTQAFKVVSPAKASKITELGWYCVTSTSESNFEMGIYSHDSTLDTPNAVVGSLSQTNAKGTTAGWKTTTVNIPITPHTTYWIACQLDDSTANSFVGKSGFTDARFATLTSQTTLADPFGTSEGFTGRLLAFYALVETSEIQGSSGTREIATRYPVDDGIIARTTKQTGHTMNLVAEQSSHITSRDRVGID